MNVALYKAPRNLAIQVSIENEIKVEVSVFMEEIKL